MDGISTGAEVNVQADWDETDTDDDSFILNKPTLNGRYIGDHAGSTAYTKGDVVFSTGQFWRAKQDVPDTRTGAPTNDLDYWQQSTFSIGMVATLPTFANNDEFGLNRDRWVIMTADQTLTGTRDGSGAAPYVADVQDTRSTSDITGNQLTALNRGDILRVDTWPTRYWARMVDAAKLNLPDAPAAQTEARNYNLQISTAGVASWQQDTGGGGTNTGEANVQSDWSRNQHRIRRIHSKQANDSVAFRPMHKSVIVHLAIRRQISRMTKKKPPELRLVRVMELVVAKKMCKPIGLKRIQRATHSF